MYFQLLLAIVEYSYILYLMRFTKCNDVMDPLQGTAKPWLTQSSKTTQQKARRIDACALVLIPLIFFMMTVVYWIYYQHG